MAEKDRDEKRTRNEAPEDERPSRGRHIEDEQESEKDHLNDFEGGFTRVDTDTNQVEENPFDDQLSDDSMLVGTDEEIVMDQIDDFTEDQDVLDDFAERQRTQAGSNKLLREFRNHNSRTPDTTGDDIDADWQSAYQSGEETVGGTEPTPDQDIVEELGEAVGLEYEYDEPLNTIDKLTERDRDRWELDPESAEELEEDFENVEDEADLAEDGEDRLSDETRRELDDY